MASNEFLNFNVGVLGHVDSGKTTLSKALSTIASTASFDKNPQSKERGITLDLGFSSFCTDIPPEFRVKNESETSIQKLKKIQYTLVDCPGHASLIRAIIGGAQIIDLMLLVVDVVKGFQTQTSECLIIGQITCNKMIVVLNKLDLIAEDKRSAVREKMERRVVKTLEKTRFAGCPIVAVAACPGGADGGGESPLGMQHLVDTLLSQTYIPRRQLTGPFIFSVDHCFSIRGQGTVMTGTVLSGQIAINNSIEIPALKVTKKVKSMQMFKTPVDSAIQGDRLGICVTQFDPKSLERGLVCEPGVLPTVTAAIAAVHKIPYFKGAVNTKAKFHVTLGHDTVMARVTVFSKRINEDERPNSDSRDEDSGKFDFVSDYEYRSELLDVVDEGAGGTTQFYALLELEKPVTCPRGSLVIGSRLDTDIHANTCRIAFHGRLIEAMTSADYTSAVLPSVRVYKTKRREGVVERVHDEGTVIVRDLFKKESNIDVFVGLRVDLSSGERGVIDGTFGKSGKVNVRIPDGVSKETQSQYANSGKKKVKSKPEGTVTAETNSQTALEPIKVFLTFKRYIFDQSKKMVQTNR